MIECVGSGACFVQSWEKGLGSAQGSRLLSAEAKLHKGLGDGKSHLEGCQFSSAMWECR